MSSAIDLWEAAAPAGSTLQPASEVRAAAQGEHCRNGVPARREGHVLTRHLIELGDEVRRVCAVVLILVEDGCRADGVRAWGVGQQVLRWVSVSADRAWCRRLYVRVSHLTQPDASQFPVQLPRRCDRGQAGIGNGLASCPQPRAPSSTRTAWR